MERERINQKNASRIIQQKQNHSINGIVDNRPYSSFPFFSNPTVQRVSEEDEETMQGKLDSSIQRMEDEDEETLQGKFYSPVQRVSEEEKDTLQGKFDKPIQKKNETGMPDNLKAGIENLSGFSMDDVRVYYNSSKPATVQALAYTQGTDIHVAPGQEKHLPHEAWHVAQQMAGRVTPTTNINGIPVNDNAALENEADVMGEKAVQCKNEVKFVKNNAVHVGSTVAQCVFHEAGPIPNVLDLDNKSSEIVGSKHDLNEYLDAFIEDGIDDIVPKKNERKWPWRLDDQNGGGNFQIQLNNYQKKGIGAEAECGVKPSYDGGTTIAVVYCVNKRIPLDNFKDALRASKRSKNVYTDSEIREETGTPPKDKKDKRDKYFYRMKKKK